MFPSYYEHKSLFLIGLINITVNSTIIVGERFNIPLTPMDRSSKQKINKEPQVLNNILNEMISLISSGHSIQIQKNTTSSQVHMEQSLR